MVKDPSKVNFSYRDNLWRGSDLLATGIASFGHVSGVHYQNLPEWDRYIESLLEDNRLPLGRALRPTPHQLLVREMILQLKRRQTGRRLLPRQVRCRHRGTCGGTSGSDYAAEGWLTVEDDRICLTREGLLRADGLLPAFFEPEHQGVRYT